MLDLWKIEYYLDVSGKDPVHDFIRSLSPAAKGKIINAINLLCEFGTQLCYPYVDKIEGTTLRELRIIGKDNIRFFYIAVSSSTFLFLHGFIKKQNKTPRKEIKIALNRLEKYKNTL